MSHKVEKDWEYKGLRCVVLALEMGHRCGYVGISESHPLYKIVYSTPTPPSLKDKMEKVKEGPIGKRGIIDVIGASADLNNLKVGLLFDVHGGITYSDGSDTYPVPDSHLWWFGFDCAHYGDAKDESIMSEKYLEIERKYGFREGIIRSLSYCISECESLAEQLEEIKIIEEGRS